MKKLLIVIFSFSLAGSSFAWGPTGHRVTGLIAERYLNVKAKKKIKSLLGQENLALVSTWMDEIRSDSTYPNMSDWHWVTVETGDSYEHSKKNPNGDAVAMIQRIIAELKSHKLSGRQEIESIKILVHLIGDIHMPLHAGCCDDQGGNKTRVKWFRTESNLHRVWDSEMIDDSRFSYTELADALGEPASSLVVRYQKNSVTDWVNESMSFRKQVYDIGDGNIGYTYAYKNFPIVKLRLLQAGIRLAGVLNEIYGA